VVALNGLPTATAGCLSLEAKQKHLLLASISHFDPERTFCLTWIELALERPNFRREGRKRVCRHPNSPQGAQEFIIQDSLNIFR
jgi:hypothetical protein